MQFRKLKAFQLAKDTLYVAYSAKNKLLSANGEAGVLVYLEEVSAAGVKVKVVSSGTVTGIAKLEAREDAYIYDPSGTEIPVQVRCADFSEWPGFTARMQAAGHNGKVIPLRLDELYHNTREGAGQGVTLVQHNGGSKHPVSGEEIRDNYRLSWLSPVEKPEWRIPRSQRMGLGAVELPLPPKPAAPESNAIIKSLMPMLERVAHGHNSENVSFMKVSADFKKTSSHLNQACHRALQEEASFEVAYIISLGSNKLGQGPTRWVKGHASKEVQTLYITYLTQYSPYKDVFITKDVDFILKYGYVLDASKPNRLVVGALFATRQEWERPFRLEGFYKLYEAGVPLDAAFLFGCQCSQFKDNKMKFAMTDGDHNHLQHGRLSDKCLVNFLKHSPDKPGVPYTESCHASKDGGVDGMWSKSFGTRSKIYEQLLDIKKTSAPSTSGWGDNALIVEDAVEIAADLIDDWLGKVDYESFRVR